MRARQPCVYILASQKRGTLYIGVTSDLGMRMWQHRQDETQGFVRRYRVYRLVFVEVADTMETAVLREKQLKRWHREWKINLIEQANPDWHDLSIELGLAEPLRHGC